MSKVFTSDEVVFGDDSQIPSNVYTVTITKFTFGKSQAGNEQTITTIEIAEPTEVDFMGGRVRVAGRTATIYNSADPSDQVRGLGRTISGLRKAGLNPKDVQELEGNQIFSVEPEMLAKFVGKQFNIYLRCVPETMQRLATPEELEQNPKMKYVEIVDETTKKPAIKGYKLSCFWTDVVGPAPGSGTGAGANPEVPPWEQSR